MIEFGQLKNNPKQRKIFIKIDNEIKFLGKIQTLPEGGICFYPSKVGNLYFLGNNKIYNRPQNESHITFHNTGRVHIGNNNVIYDYGIYDSSKKAKNKDKTRDSISNHKPQLLFKLKISELEFLEIYNNKLQNSDILLELENKDQKLLFTCGIFDGKNLNEALISGDDTFGLTKIGNFKNTYRIGLGEFEDVTEVKDGNKILFLVLREFQESSSSKEFQDYPYIISVMPYSINGEQPY